jgi:glutathione S-transferase
MRLYQFPGSPHCLKVRAVAYELGVELELITIDIFRGEARAAEFGSLNPNGLVPVLVDRDFVLWESNAILTYLASTSVSPELLPTRARERADVDRWLHWQSAHLAPAMSRVGLECIIKPLTGQASVDHSAAAMAACDFKAHCRALEASLRDKEYIAGRLSVADFALAAILNHAATVGLCVEPFPRTTAWLRRMLTRDSMRRALAEGRLSVSEMYPLAPDGGADRAGRRGRA